jgi:hypothetical protein
MMRMLGARREDCGGCGKTSHNTRICTAETVGPDAVNALGEYRSAP